MTKKDLTGVEIEQMPTRYAEVIALEIYLSIDHGRFPLSREGDPGKTNI